MKKTERLYMRVDKDTKDKIEKIAKQENRSMSNWIENIIVEKLQGENKMTKRINLKEVLGFVANGENCKVMIDDGQVDVYPANAQGHGEVVVELEAYDFEECDSVEEFAEWVNDGFRSTDKDFELK